ncbi:hypothetical protein HDU67_009291 [Dinochytrium kinnereticum]|nr:hypothetical protein HDU67_009291 [Dinochytrium kinnereticum]
MQLVDELAEEEGRIDRETLHHPSKTFRGSVAVNGLKVLCDCAATSPSAILPAPEPAHCPHHLLAILDRQARFQRTVAAISNIVVRKLYRHRVSNLETYFKQEFHISRAQHLSHFDIRPSRERICRSLKHLAKNSPEHMVKLWANILAHVKEKRYDTITSRMIEARWKDLVDAEELGSSSASSSSSLSTSSSLKKTPTMISDSAPSLPAAADSSVPDDADRSSPRSSVGDENNSLAHHHRPSVSPVPHGGGGGVRRILAAAAAADASMTSSSPSPFSPSSTEPSKLSKPEESGDDQSTITNGKKSGTTTTKAATATTALGAMEVDDSAVAGSDALLALYRGSHGSADASTGSLSSAPDVELQPSAANVKKKKRSRSIDPSGDGSSPCSQDGEKARRESEEGSSSVGPPPPLRRRMASPERGRGAGGEEGGGDDPTSALMALSRGAFEQHRGAALNGVMGGGRGQCGV